MSIALAVHQAVLGHHLRGCSKCSHRLPNSPHPAELSRSSLQSAFSTTTTFPSRPERERREKRGLLPLPSTILPSLQRIQYLHQHIETSKPYPGAELINNLPVVLDSSSVLQLTFESPQLRSLRYTISLDHSSTRLICAKLKPFNMVTNNIRRPSSRPPSQYGPPADHSSVSKPQSKYNHIGHFGRPPGPSPPPPPSLIPPYEEKDWDEIIIRVAGLRPGETTYSLFTSFRHEGNPSFVEIFDNKGERNAGQVKFSPAPATKFWAGGRYMLVDDQERPRYVVFVQLGNRSGKKVVHSPIKPWITYPPKFRLNASMLHFGIMISPDSMMPHHATQVDKKEGPKGDITIIVDLLRRRLNAKFLVDFVDPRSTGDRNYESLLPIGKLDRKNEFMFQIPFSQLTTISRVEMGNEGVFGLSITLDSPPRFYRKHSEKKAGHSDETNTWSEFNTWYRQTDVVFDPPQLKTTNIALHKQKPVIDIGRWTSYLFEIPKTENDPTNYSNMKQALQDFNIEIVDIPYLNRAEPHDATLWPLIDPQLSDLQYLVNTEQLVTLPFEVRYQLEVCISRETLNEYNITAQFVLRLGDMAAEDPTKARNILEYVAGQEKRVYDPIAIFEDPEALSFSAKTDIPHYCAYVRKATVTPSTIYFSSPTVETTNRVLRQYQRENREGRFLRVTFTDELAEGRINSSAHTQRNDELFTRVYRTLYNGIQIGDRHYEFLAFGNSQFRENGAYFFCPTSSTSCNDIRDWMGSFSHIKVVAKYAARLGQCFSTTRAINGLSKPDVVKIPDIEVKRADGVLHTFTDGVGKISPFLAQMIAAELGIKGNAAPSAFQFRLGGCKGILVVWPEAKEKEVHIRRSQQKFTAIYNGLEIIRCSHFSVATLNRQTITLLSALGVPDEVFLNMLTEQLANYQQAMSNDELAMSLLLRYIDDNQMTINIATMIRNGFMAEREPFVLSLLRLWRSWSIKLLKEKAKIIVENGAFVLGCVDETATLRGYTTPKTAHDEQCSVDELPQIFLQVPDKEDPNRYNVIEGICLVGRNPSLHPGDLRVVQAVDVPALHHLRDVVVFPRTGERDIPSMCSGGDLDGDDYFVLWDKNLQPPEWNAEPMSYDPPKPKEIGRKVKIEDLMKFFVRYMKNDALPTIAHAHLCQSDLLERGVKDPKCLELAALHSKAVDYVKTGEAAQMPKHLRPNKWPHFMEKIYKPKEQQYVSTKILGQLYDKVESVNFVPQYEKPFDNRILRAYTLDDALLKKVRQTKTKYDTAIRRIMAQQDIKTEFEIWTGFVLSRPRTGSDYKMQEEIARISDALKDQFRAVCIEQAGGKEFKILGPFVAGMYKVTKEEMSIALAECKKTRTVGGREIPLRKMDPKHMPLMSFPWLFEKELGIIATGVDVSDELEDMGVMQMTLNELNPGRKRGKGGVVPVDDYIQEEDGRIVHRGEELDLFRHDPNSDEGESDDNDLLSDPEEHRIMKGRNGEAILETEFDFTNAELPDEFGIGTGVEDVVPQSKMDGFVTNKVEVGSVGLVRSSWSHPAASSRPQTASSEVKGLEPVSEVHSTTFVLKADSEASGTTPSPTRLTYSSSTKDFTPSSTGSNISTPQEVDEEEEVVTLNIPESTIDRMAKYMGNASTSLDPTVPAFELAGWYSTQANHNVVNGAEEDEEVVTLQSGETGIDRVRKFME